MISTTPPLPPICRDSETGFKSQLNAVNQRPPAIYAMADSFRRLMLPSHGFHAHGPKYARTHRPQLPNVSKLRI